jgi:diguanylate cyclase (GGDEF)-like protein/PAS domain S-box-containing protein
VIAVVDVDGLDDEGTIAELRARLGAAEETLRAIQSGEVDAIVVDGDRPRIFTLQGVGEVYQTFVETMREGAATIDRTGLILYANRQMAQMLGQPLHRLIGSRIDDHVPLGAPPVLALLAAGDGEHAVELPMCHRDGTMVPVLLSWAVPDDAEGDGMVCAVMTDLTEVVAGQAASRHLAAIVDGTDEAVIGVTPTGEVESINAGALRLFGLDLLTAGTGGGVADLLGEDVGSLVRRTAADARSHRADVVDGVGGPGVLAVSIIASPMLDGTGRLVGVSLLGHDVTARHEAESRLRRRAHHDELTGLPNRVGLLDRIESELSRDVESFVAVLFVDLDRFKLVNDSLGHSGGDELLRSLSRRLQDVLRPGDVAARVGGDEFVVLCGRLGPDRGRAAAAAGQVARRLSEVIAEPVTDRAGRTLLRPSASVGIAMVRGDEHRAESILHDADTAMYRAKARGRSQIVTFDDDMRRRTVRREAAIADARRVLEEDRLRVHYQPLVRMVDREVIGHEALLRWWQPSRGLQSPDALLDVADDAGMTLAIGDWVLETAISRAASLDARDGNATLMSINIAAAQLGRGLIADRMQALVAEYGVEPERIGLEVTEGVSLDRSDEVFRELLDLARAGFRLALDDFGTGYASLTHLKRLPLTYVKIDKSFVSSIGADASGVDLVDPIIRLARAVGLQVVAEGVESQSQADALLDLGCDVGQGYLFGHPAPDPL